MNYEELEIALAFNECEKAFLLEDARCKLKELGDTFYEEEEKKPGILEKIKTLIEKVKTWFNEHFKGKSRIKVKKEDAKKIKETNSILTKLKSNVKDPKLWKRLGLLAAGGALTYAGVKKHQSNQVKKVKNDIERESTILTEYISDKKHDDSMVEIEPFNAGEVCESVVKNLDDLYKHRKIKYEDYIERLKLLPEILNIKYKTYRDLSDHTLTNNELKNTINDWNTRYTKRKNREN